MIIVILIFGLAKVTLAQYPPAADEAGTTAIRYDSGVFIGWASSCTINRGYVQLNNPSLGLATIGDSLSAIGAANTAGVVSLGDKGEAILQFSYPVRDSIGFDFAVFENSFNDEFLELAYVEVSSDGTNYFRFCSDNQNDNTVQCDTFGLSDPTKINNLAGKYRAMYGTPFDLAELDGIVGLDINAITHIRIIDVGGSINDTLASYDCSNDVINDPFPTPFVSSGFDLDAIGIIHDHNPNPIPYTYIPTIDNDNSFFAIHNGDLVSLYTINSLQVINVMGQEIFALDMLSEQDHINVNDLYGLFILRFKYNNKVYLQKIFLN